MGHARKHSAPGPPTLAGSCLRKVFHATEASAEEHLRAVTKHRNFRHDHPLHVYKCAFCAGFHVGGVGPGAAGSEEKGPCGL